MNCYLCTGKLITPVELRTTAAGSDVASFRISLLDSPHVWLRCTAWDDIVWIAQSLRVGDVILAFGRLAVSPGTHGGAHRHELEFCLARIERIEPMPDLKAASTAPAEAR